VATMIRIIVEVIQSSVRCAGVMPTMFLTFYDEAHDGESTNLRRPQGVILLVISSWRGFV
jgi:hypothetical protein